MPPSRLFPEHHVREILPLDGAWDLYLPPTGTKLEPAAWHTGRRFDFLVPGVWEVQWGLENYRGEAVARRTFSTSRPGAARLVFHGVSHTARVVLDGQEVGRHHNAFTPFAVDCAHLAKGEHELLVHISNEHDPALSTLHIPNDYYNYGGINRPVEAQLLRAACYVRRIRVIPRRSGGIWHADTEVVLANLGGPGLAGLTLSVAGVEHVFPPTTLASGETALAVRMPCPGVACWNPEHPVLYDVVATLAIAGEIVDDLRDRIGFREVRCEGAQLLLNDEPIFLLGVNRHEDHPAFGSALPLEIHYQDVLAIRHLGANTVRTSHYPNDQRFLDLCDQMGLLVWEENHARGQTLEQMQAPLFRTQCRDCIEEMVHSHANHPSIILWGLLNECASDSTAGRLVYEQQIRQVRVLDSSRPVSFATNRYGADLCLDLADLSSWNVYFNWYQDRAPAPALEETIAYTDAHGGGNKPLLITEFGGGGIPGFHDPRRNPKWSEERQAQILAECLETFLAHPRLSGAIIWQFCDVRVDEAWALVRPRCLNDKGLLDDYRRPKLAYAAVRRIFLAHRAKTAHTPTKPPIS
ncbi:MAG: beta-galactosidase [Verrucomicrobia bacterium]|nr:beta-galactosidase [Verrucomicrobiota bacterium]